MQKTSFVTPHCPFEQILPNKTGVSRCRTSKASVTFYRQLFIVHSLAVGQQASHEPCINSFGARTMFKRQGWCCKEFFTFATKMSHAGWIIAMIHWFQAEDNCSNCVLAEKIALPRISADSCQLSKFSVNWSHFCRQLYLLPTSYIQQASQELYRNLDGQAPFGLSTTRWQHHHIIYDRLTCNLFLQWGDCLNNVDMDTCDVTTIEPSEKWFYTKVDSFRLNGSINQSSSQSIITCMHIELMMCSWWITS